MTTAKINTTIENRIHKDFTSVHTHNGCVIKLLCCSWQKSECDLCRGRCDRDRDRDRDRGLQWLKALEQMLLM